MGNHAFEQVERGASFLDSLAAPQFDNQAGNIPDMAATEAETSDDAPEDEKKQPSQASLLVAFVEERSNLFHDQNGDVFAQDFETKETRRIDGRQFKDWLTAGFYTATGKSPRDQSMREAVSTLSGLGRHKGECRDVSVRVALADGVYYLDLGEDGKSRAVRISPGLWEIVTTPPAMFVRPESMRPLPAPVGGGSIARLWEYVNIPADSRLLVLAWMAECLRPDTPFPILELMGEAGSAKSTTQTVIRRMLDPNACDLRAAPKSAEDMFVAAGVSWLVSYENISHLPAPMQDALCVLATGGGFAKRKLYSDADESVITVKRPVVLNGISVAVTAQDLVDRAVTVELPTITARAEVTDIWRKFDADHGRLVGAFLDVVVGALEILPSIHLPPADRPRLAEFARLGMAVAQATGQDPAAFLDQFKASRMEAIGRTIDASPVATAIIEWLERNPAGRTDSAKNLMQAMIRPANCEAWPHSPKGFADAMRRAAPALRQMGIECRSKGKVGSSVQWEIKPRINSSNPCRASRDVVQNDGKDPIQHDMTTCTTSFPGVSSAGAYTEVDV